MAREIEAGKETDKKCSFLLSNLTKLDAACGKNASELYKLDKFVKGYMDVLDDKIAN